MSISRIDGRMTFWDFGEPVQYIQKSNTTGSLRFWDFGEPFLYGDILSQQGGSFFLLAWGA